MDPLPPENHMNIPYVTNAGLEFGPLCPGDPMSPYTKHLPGLGCPNGMELLLNDTEFLSPITNIVSYKVIFGQPQNSNKQYFTPLLMFSQPVEAAKIEFVSVVRHCYSGTSKRSLFRIFEFSGS